MASRGMVLQTHGTHRHTAKGPARKLRENKITVTHARVFRRQGCSQSHASGVHWYRHAAMLRGTVRSEGENTTGMGWGCGIAQRTKHADAVNWQMVLHVCGRYFTAITWAVQCVERQLLQASAPPVGPAVTLSLVMSISLEGIRWGNGGVFAQRGHSAGTAPIITVIIRVTTLKTTHLRNHAQSI